MTEVNMKVFFVVVVAAIVGLFSFCFVFFGFFPSHRYLKEDCNQQKSYTIYEYFWNICPPPKKKPRPTLNDHSRWHWSMVQMYIKLVFSLLVPPDPLSSVSPFVCCPEVGEGVKGECAVVHLFLFYVYVNTI